MTDRTPTSDAPLECGYFAQCEQDAEHDGPHTSGMYPEWTVPTIEPMAFIASVGLDPEPDALMLAICEAARIEASRTSGYRHLRSDESWNAKEYRVREKITQSAFRRLMAIRRLARSASQSRPERPPTIEEMAAQQGVTPIKSADDLRIDLTDEEAEAFETAMQFERSAGLDVERLARAMEQACDALSVNSLSPGDAPVLYARLASTSTEPTEPEMGE